MKKTTVDLDEKVHKDVRVFCAVNECQINTFVSEAITEKLERDLGD